MKTYHADCTKKLFEIEDNSIDVILTDPPYLYLKGQKLEREFDELSETERGTNGYGSTGK